jgi:predicted acyltransferase
MDQMILSPRPATLQLYRQAVNAGKIHRGNHDPEGIMSTVPAISTALLGMFTGEFMKSDFLKQKRSKKCSFYPGRYSHDALGKIWDQAFPINKTFGHVHLCAMLEG